MCLVNQTVWDSNEYINPCFINIINSVINIFFHTEWSNMPPTVSWYTGKAVQRSLVKYLDLITADYLMNETYG